MNNRFLQFLGLTKKSGNLVEGYNRCEEILKKKTIYLFIFSKEVSQNTREKFIRFCEINNVNYIDNIPKQELGFALGKSEINVIAVMDKNMALKLQSLYENID